MRSAFFIVNLMQDVNILRPLVYLASRDLGLSTHVLMTKEFVKRDKHKIWAEEIASIRAATGSGMTLVSETSDAVKAMQAHHGVLIAASESNLSAHTPAHDMHRAAPKGFLRITLQHGFECVGFLQSREHDIAHGRTITFAADVICGWCEPWRLTSLAPSQAPKLYVTGPTSVLQAGRQAAPGDVGLVCENLHSVRLREFTGGFIGTFEAFAAHLAHGHRRVALRPHPGGQYVLRKNVKLPPNAVLTNDPIYRIDLSSYAYGISAPSSILIDMVLARIPTAVWRDEGGVMDAGNYRGLTEIRTASDWLAFDREARADRSAFVSRQADFLVRQGMITDPRAVHERFARLLAAGAGTATAATTGGRRRERVLFVANSYVPTLQLSFVKPLAAMVEAGDVTTAFVLEDDLRQRFGKDAAGERAGASIIETIEAFSPTIIVFCRYSGPHAGLMAKLARERSIPMVYQIDDDLLHVPPDIGERKSRFHMSPDRTSAVRTLLDTVDLVYCSTHRLAQRMRSLGVTRPVVAGEIYCAGEIINPPTRRTPPKAGYMASADHAHNLARVLPAVIGWLDANPETGFELFGSIPKPPDLDRFGSRITTAPPVADYGEFLSTFARRDWDIGICPLSPIDFNLFKADTKWVEYTSAGVAVIASRGTVYDDSCADGCGVLADTAEEWQAALQCLTDPEQRFGIVSRAQAKLATVYPLERLREQVLSVLRTAKAIALTRSDTASAAARPRAS